MKNYVKGHDRSDEGQKFKSVDEEEQGKSIKGHLMSFDRISRKIRKFLAKDPNIS